MMMIVPTYDVLRHLASTVQSAATSRSSQIDVRAVFQQCFQHWLATRVIQYIFQREVQRIYVVVRSRIHVCAVVQKELQLKKIEE